MTEERIIEGLQVACSYVAREGFRLTEVSIGKKGMALMKGKTEIELPSGKVRIIE